MARFARPSLALTALFAVSCRPQATAHDPAVAGDPGPPAAPVVATLTAHGTVSGDDRVSDVATLGIEVVEYGPEGEGWYGRELGLRFNQPMADTSTPTVTFDPPLSGKTVWVDAFHLAFTPDGDGVELAHAYTVHVKGNVESVTGLRENVDLSWKVMTERPTVAIEPEYSYRYGWHDDDTQLRHWKTALEITTSQPVTQAALRKALRVTADGKPVAYRLKRAKQYAYRVLREDPAGPWLVQPLGRWPLGSKIAVEIPDDTLVAKWGPLPVLTGTRASFQTSDGARAKVECDDPFEGGCGPSSLSLTFDHEIDRRELRKISVSPRPKGLTVEPAWVDDGMFTEVDIWGELEVGQHYTIRVAPSLHDAMGQPYVGPRKFEVDIVPPDPSLELSSNEAILSATQSPHIGLETRYLRNAELDVAKLDNARLALLVGTQEMHRKFPRKAPSTRTELRLKPGGKYSWTSNVIDVAKVLDASTGAIFVRATPGALVAGAPVKVKPKAVQSLVQLTDLGGVAGTSPAMSFVRVNRLSTGAPVEGAHVTVYSVDAGRAKRHSRHGPSDEDGVVRLPREDKLPAHAVAVITTDDDRFALRMPVGDGPTVGWRRPQKEGEFLVGAAVTDRPLYKPGETVRVIGWAAKSTSSTASGLRPIGRPMVDVELLDNGDRVVAKRRVRVKEYGKFWAALTLPEAVGLGSFTARATVEEETIEARFKVRDFRTPSFEVRMGVAEGDVLRGDDVPITANATYLHGMPVPIKRARVHGRCTSRSFTPASHPGWLAAVPKSERYSHSLTDGVLGLGEAAEAGTVAWTENTAGLPPGGAYGCSAEVAIQDAAEQEMGADASYNVHPTRYLLMSPTPWSITDPMDVSVEAVDFGGSRVDGGKVTLTLRQQWWESGEWKEKVVDTCKRSVATTGAAKCTFAPKKQGRYLVRLAGTVDGATVTAERSFRYYQRQKVKPRPKPTTPTSFTMAASASNLEVGDELVLTFATPEEKATGLLARMHGGLRSLQRFETRDHAGQMALAVEDAWIPATSFHAFVTTAGTAKTLPTVREAWTRLTVPFESRRLQVGVASPESVGPGDEVSIAVDVRDPEGLGVAAHVTVWAVDEAVLALEDFRFPDFVAEFAVDRGSESRFANDFGFLRFPYVQRGDPWEVRGIGLGGYGSGGGGGSGSGYGRGGAALAPKVRRKFEATPIFIADAFTGEDGRVTVKGTMPENLTTFRVLAIASASVPKGKAIGRFGRGETRTRVTTDLAVRPVVPRVMRPGDTAEIAALVDNLVGAQGRVAVTVELRDNDGVARLRGRTKKREKAGPQTRIPFELEALEPGTVKVRVTATLDPAGRGDALTDAMEVELPVTLERTMLRRAGYYGSLSEEEAVAVAVAPPEDAAAGSRKVDVSVHTSLIGGYKGNVDDIVSYPYGCVEQTSTKLVPLLALAELDETYPLGIGDAKVFVREAVARIQTMQTSDGGFGYWPGATQTHFYATAYASWVLAQAAEAGHPVPVQMLDRARDYLAGRIEAWDEDDTPTAHEDVRMAMALQAVAALGGKAEAGITRLYERRKKLPIFAKAMLLMAMRDDDERRADLLAEILERVEERDAFARTRAPAIRFTQFFDSPTRTDAIVLLALTKVAPDHALVEKFARGLSHARDAGRLRNTQENAYAILAMAAYARLREVEEPNMFARAWVGSHLVGEATFEGRTFDIEAASRTLADRGRSKVTFAKQGAGRLYYRVGMEWTPARPPTKPVAQGLVLERRLSATTIGAGDPVKLELELTADTQQDYVVVEVPLPAGLEAIDTSIGKGHRAGGSGGHAWWADHRELRSDRIILFADHLGPGRHTASLPLRATTPGHYAMPPARAESMYYPEIYGYTAGSTIDITPPGT